MNTLDKPWLLELSELSTHPLFLTQRDKRNWQDDPKLREIQSTVAEIKTIERNALEAFNRKDSEVSIPSPTCSIQLPHPKPAVNQLAFRESFMDAYFELHKKIKTVESSYLDLPVIYIWDAYVWAWLGSYDSAYISLSSALLRCVDKAELCYEMGKLQSEQNRVSAIGWWMQSCMLAYDIPHPYLYIAAAASEMRLTDLELRLLNLCDTYWAMLRLPTDEDIEIRDLAKRDTKNIKESLENFEKFMAPFLPVTELLPSPKDNLGRAQDIEVQKFFGESSPLIQEKVRLQHIFDRGKGFILEM